MINIVFLELLNEVTIRPLHVRKVKKYLKSNN